MFLDYQRKEEIDNEVKDTQGYSLPLQYWDRCSDSPVSHKRTKFTVEA